MSNQKFSMNPWSEEFGSTGNLNVKVNLTLSQELLKSINCSARQLCRIIGDPNNNYLTRNNPSAHYEKVRATADFLGLPPWVIFTEERNKKINSLYENATSPFKTFNISIIRENFKKIEKDLSRANLTKNKRAKFYSYLGEIEKALIKNSANFDDTWGEIFEFLKEEFKEETVDWGCHISLNNGSSIGTFRIRKWKEVDESDKNKKIGSWSSAWFYYKQIDTNQPYPNDLLEEIFKDITTLIENTFWEFPIYIPSTQSSANLYSWHSNRVDALDREQHNRIKSKIPLPPNFKVSPEPVICLIGGFSTKKEEYLNDIGDINDLINWLEDNENIVDNSSNMLRFNTLQLLLDRNYLKENDRLIYKYSNDYTYSNMDNTKSYCTLVIQNGKPKVKWDYDDKIYSISSLTKQMLLESERISPSTKPISNKYWRIEGVFTSASLYDVANKIKKDDKSGQSHLF